ncbi:B3 domain-containing protein os01g0723500 [Phtheirospermum japonicum]|uniref:B3 domain-containing protein os01g0723500 n=1 Tax=Phtheirospermum japonicum TaxID=374723 RepID=A0A830CHG6_9LAMI|nr:B3 domain-containing protein os01g0723500 [Phtheirospermum japonicum]
MWATRRPHFLLGFDPTLCSERLNIPCNFVKYMEGRAQGTVLLVGPSGNIWYVELITVENGLFLNDGWADFVRDHFLEHGEAMVFRYDGDLRFTVQIFDRSMCEKENAFTAESSQDLSKHGIELMRKRDRERSALLYGIFEGVPKKMRCSQTQSQSTCNDHQNGTNEVHALEWTGQANGNIHLETDVTVALPLTAVPHENNDDSPVRSRATKLDMLLSASEADRMARSFQSPFPNFLKVMKRFNISGSYTLNIPYQFATEHLPKCKVKIVLRNLKGESWTVNSIPTTRVQTSHTFCGGWLGFVRDNNIGIGDICIFELLRKCELQVRIIRVGKDEIDGEAANEGKNNGCKKILNKTFTHKSKKVSGSVVNGSVLSSQSSNCVVESDVYKRFGSLDKQGSQTKGCMSLKSVPEEKMAAQYFISSFPHFVRVMKKFNISGSFTLKIPYQFSTEHLPNCKTEIILRNLNGKCWTVNSVPTMKVQALHTFCGGWMAFVRDNDVQMGDICIFELVGKCEMRVHICGIGKKGLNYTNGTKNLHIS